MLPPAALGQHDQVQMQSMTLLTPSKFEATLEQSLQDTTTDRSPDRLILIGFGGLDLLITDLGTQGTRALLSTARARMSTLIPASTPACHLFGDRFALLVHGREESERLTARIRAGLRLAHLDLMPRFGVAAARDALSAQDLIRRASAALIRAESNGSPKATLYQTTQMPLCTPDAALMRELGPALMDGQIQPWFQPVWRLSDGALVSVEALARWIHPERGVLLPGTFLPCARRAGLLAELDATIRSQALAWLATMRERHPQAANLSVAVNVADADLADADLLETLTAELAVHDLPTSAMHLELSEGSTTAQTDEIQSRIRRIAAAGFRWHLDDFGAGHSNLQRLCGLPLAAVKLDRSLVCGIGRDPHAERLLEPMLALARVLDLEVIAEGVERHDQHQILRRLHCDMAQGHHLSPPRPADAIERLLSHTTPTHQAAPRVAPEAGRHEPIRNV